MLLIISIIVLLSSIIINERSINSLFFRMTSNICAICMHLCGTFEKSLLLYLILIRFKHLNEKIVPKVSWNNNQYEPKAIDISNVQIMHSVLYDAQQAFSDIYRNPMLIWFANLMIHVLGNVHLFRETSLIIASIFIFFPIMQMFILCAICHYTAEEVHEK